MIKGEAKFDLSVETVMAAIEAHINASLVNGAEVTVTGVAAETVHSISPIERVIVSVMPACMPKSPEAGVAA